MLNVATVCMVFWLVEFYHEGCLLCPTNVLEKLSATDFGQSFEVFGISIIAIGASPICQQLPQHQCDCDFRNLVPA